MTNKILETPYLAHRMLITVLLVFVAMAGSFGQCTIAGSGTISWQNAPNAPTCVEGGRATDYLVLIVPDGVNLDFDHSGDSFTGLGIIVDGMVSITFSGQITINGSFLVRDGGILNIASKLNLGSTTGCGYQINIDLGGLLNIVGDTPDRLEICGREIARGGIAGCHPFIAGGPLPYCEPPGGFTNVGLGENGITVGINPLPVELLFFKAVSGEGRINLKWATATERNADFFAVERSLDGKEFTEVGQVKASGNSIGRVDYSFIDNNPILGRTYYRLKQVDFNGDFEYFNITFSDTDGKRSISVAPNPVENSTLQLSLNFAVDEQIQAKVYNSGGMLVKSISFYGTAYREETNLRPGAYLIKVAAGKEIFTERFIVK